jgi:hypothetical protein
MMQLSDHDLFEQLESPFCGVTIHVLSRRVAPTQQSFYFVNDGMSADGRFLWFYCGHTPARGRTLAVIDFTSGQIHRFPETQFNHAGPFVDPDTGEVYWGSGSEIWRRKPNPEASAECVNRLPDAWISGKPVRKSATHLTRSADGREFFIDAQIGLQYVFGSLPVDGGEGELWHRFDRNYNHAQFSPTDPDEILFAQENHVDPLTGIRTGHENRLWTMRRGESPRPIMEGIRGMTHEWWDADGKYAWCVHGNQTWRVRIADGQIEKIDFPRHCWHSHCSRDGKLIVGDSNDGFFRGCPSSVHMLNRATGQCIKLLENPGRDDFAGRNYHIDPHPRFCCGDRYVVFTTTVRGTVDLAAVHTADLIAATS